MLIYSSNTNDLQSFPMDERKLKDLIKEGSNIDVLIDAGTEEPLTVEMPRNVELVVTKTDPGLKGDTATGATKPAEVESGATVMVPLFINEGDVIRVDTETGSYGTRGTAA